MMQQMLLGYGGPAPNVWATLSSADADTKDNAVPNLSNGNLTAANSARAVGIMVEQLLDLQLENGTGRLHPVEMLLLELNLLPKILIERILTRVRQQGMSTRDGKVWFAGSQVYSGGSDWSNGDTIGFAFNANTGHMCIYINGS